MTPELWIQLTSVLLPAILVFMTIAGTVVTALITYYSEKRSAARQKDTEQRITAVQEETKQQTATIGETATSVKETSIKADTIIEKAVEIHTATNGHLSKLQSALDVAITKIEAMQQKNESMERAIAVMVTDKKTAETIAAKLAAKVGTAVPPVSATDPNQMYVRDVKIEGTLETKE